MADPTTTDTTTTETGPEADFFSIWRPLLGYVCVASFTVLFVVDPLLVAISTFHGHPISIQPIDTTALLSVVGTAAVSVGVRTFEKVMNVHNSH
jgi:Holin of 3TMs, for gene-transfer release